MSFFYVQRLYGENSTIKDRMQIFQGGEIIIKILLFQVS